MDRALKLDPLDSFSGAMKGQFLFHARRYAQAVDHLNKSLETEPNFWIGQIQLGMNYEREGRYEEALEAFRKDRESSGTTAPLSLAGYTLAAWGRTAEAERTLRELQTISAKSYVPPYNFAVIYQGLGNPDETLRWLERAYDERDVRMVFLSADRKWDALRSDPRFIGLLERMKFSR